MSDFLAAMVALRCLRYMRTTSHFSKADAFIDTDFVLVRFKKIVLKPDSTGSLVSFSFQE